MHCGLKKTQARSRDSAQRSARRTAAAVFTTNQVAAAPVVLSARTCKKSRAEDARGMIVNSGNANCCTGPEGYRRLRRHRRRLGAATGRRRPVADARLLHGRDRRAAARGKNSRRACPSWCASRKRGAEAFEEFARAIMTTDTRPSGPRQRFASAARQVRIVGCAKGSGMIHPNMATMLGFIATDAAISPRRCSSRALTRCRRRAPSTPSPSMATPRPTTRWRCSPTASPARARITATDAELQKILRRARTRSASHWRSRSSPTARARSA